MERTDYKKIIRELMGDYRYNHSVNVADEAVKLAELYGCDVEKPTPREFCTISQRKFRRMSSCKLSRAVV